MTEEKKLTRAQIKKNAKARVQEVLGKASKRYDFVEMISNSDEDPGKFNELQTLIFGEDLEDAFAVVNDSASAFDVLMREILSGEDLGKA